MKRYFLLFAILLSAAGLLAQTPKISNLVVTGQNTKWYNASSEGTEYTSPATTNLVDGQTYSASQTVNGVESMLRLAVLVTMTNP